MRNWLLIRHSRKKHCLDGARNETGEKKKRVLGVFYSFLWLLLIWYWLPDIGQISHSALRIDADGCVCVGGGGSWQGTLESLIRSVTHEGCIIDLNAFFSDWNETDVLIVNAGLARMYLHTLFLIYRRVTIVCRLTFCCKSLFIFLNSSAVKEHRQPTVFPTLHKTKAFPCLLMNSFMDRCELNHLQLNTCKTKKAVLFEELDPLHVVSENSLNPGQSLPHPTQCPGRTEEHVRYLFPPILRFSFFPHHVFFWLWFFYFFLNWEWQQQDKTFPSGTNKSFFNLKCFFPKLTSELTVNAETQVNCSQILQMCSLRPVCTNSPSPWKEQMCKVSEAPTLPVASVTKGRVALFPGNTNNCRVYTISSRE